MREEENTIGDEKLGAYLGGQLDAAEAAEIEAALAADSELRNRAERVRRAREDSNVLQFPRAAEPAKRLSGIQWAALAAALGGALIVGRLSAPENGPFVMRGDALYAGPGLERVLTTQLASTQRINTATRIGLTFRATDGSFCRTFIYAGAVSGLACRESGAWRIRMTAQAEPRSIALRAPAEATAVLNAASAIIQGEPFDAAGEAEAKRVGWR